MTKNHSKFRNFYSIGLKFVWKMTNVHIAL